MKQLSKIAMRVNPSTTLAIDSLAKQMKADGLDVISFGTGEPDFMTPENISEAGIAAIREGKTKYTPAAGIVQLRKAAAERLKADCGLDYDYTQIVIASGAKHNVYAALRVLLDPRRGDSARALLGELLRDGEHMRRRAGRGGNG
mgnify:CR=1 FL=1